MRRPGRENHKHEEGAGLMDVSQHGVAVLNDRGVY